jgi:hypothetical protein
VEANNRAGLIEIIGAANNCAAMTVTDRHIAAVSGILNCDVNPSCAICRAN